jgi:hypothetical protein
MRMIEALTGSQADAGLAQQIEQRQYRAGIVLAIAVERDNERRTCCTDTGEDRRTLAETLLVVRRAELRGTTLESLEDAARVVSAAVIDRRRSRSGHQPGPWRSPELQRRGFPLRLVRE